MLLLVLFGSDNRDILISFGVALNAQKLPVSDLLEKHTCKTLCKIYRRMRGVWCTALLSQMTG